MHLLCMHAMWQHKWQAGEGKGEGVSATGHTTSEPEQAKAKARQVKPSSHAPRPQPTRPNVAFPAVAHKKVVKRCRRLWTCV